jgi:hypothetical protein
VTYLALSQVQAWLQSTKYPISHVDATIETVEATTVIGNLNARYDTSTWTNGTTTPPMVVSIISMKVAAAELRRVAGEEDGRYEYAKWLEDRANQLTDDIVNAVIDLPGIDPSTASVLGGGPLFWPTDLSTTMAFEDPTQPGTTPQAFGMDRVF